MSPKSLGVRLEQHATATGNSYVANHEPSFWLRARLADLGTRLLTGQLETCPSLRAHQDAFVALWASDWLACGRLECVHCTSRVRLTGDADRTCDRCSAVVDTIHPTVVVGGANLLVTFGLCGPCHRREGSR